uniref:Protein krueppel n=1 Tax=Globodera pallida TaxID=36090 RepID=A0A183BZR1_GLOPA
MGACKEVRRLRARIAQLERQQTMNLRTSSSAKRNEAAKCVESKRVAQLELGMNQLKGKLAKMRANQNKQQLNIVALEKKVAVLNDTINGNGLNQLKQNRNEGKKSVDKRHKCTHCPYSTHRSHNLKMHMLIHTGEKPHECQQCGQRFRMGQHLSEHLRVHTGEKPFICEECGQQFRQTHHLSDHQRVHTGEKPFICKYCQTKFTLRQNLKAHLHRFH